MVELVQNLKRRGLLHLKYFRAFVLWYLAFATAREYGFAEVVVIFTAFAAIFMNLGQREAGTLSAYSVFNRNFEEVCFFP